MDEALHRSTASSQAFRGHMQQLEVDCQARMQQLEVDCQACMQQLEVDCQARLQQREAEFKGLEKDCFANVEATAKLHEAASQKSGHLQKMLDVSKRKTADLVEHVDCLKDRKRQLKRLVTGLDERMAVLQSSLDACKRNMRELEDENASLLQRSAELEHEQKAMKQQVQHLQRDLDQAHQAARSKYGQGQQQAAPQAAAPQLSVSRQLLQKTRREAVLKEIVLLMGEQQTALTNEKLSLESELAAALQAIRVHAASAAAAETIIQHQGASLAAAKQASEQHAISLAAAQDAADKAARQASEQHAISLAAAQEGADKAARQASEQHAISLAAAQEAAEKAAMQAAKQEAEILATIKAVQEKARLETAHLHAADREVWAAEKAELLSQLRCARTEQPLLAVQQPVPDAHSTQLHTGHVELTSAQPTVQRLQEQPADDNAWTAAASNAQINMQLLAADSSPSPAHVTATRSAGSALNSQAGPQTVAPATAGHQMGSPLHDLLQKGCCQSGGHVQVTAVDQQSDNDVAVEQLQDLPQQLQQTALHLHDVPDEGRANAARSAHPAESQQAHKLVTAEQLVEQLQGLQQSAPHMPVVPDGTSSQFAAHSQPTHNAELDSPSTVRQLTHWLKYLQHNCLPLHNVANEARNESAAQGQGAGHEQVEGPATAVHVMKQRQQVQQDQQHMAPAHLQAEGSHACPHAGQACQGDMGESEAQPDHHELGETAPWMPALDIPRQGNADSSNFHDRCGNSLNASLSEPDQDAKLPLHTASVTHGTSGTITGKLALLHGLDLCVALSLHCCKE